MRPSRILFACPQTLFDVSNGASLQCSVMLWALARAGVECMSIGGGIFDNPSGLARIPDLAEQIRANQGRDILVNTDYSAGKDRPIRHCFFTGFKSTVWQDMTLREAGKFLIEFIKVIRSFKPDLIIGYGCDPLCRSMWQEARLFGIPVAYLIVNGNHKNFRFPLHDILITDSQATSDFYLRVEHLKVEPYGICINPAAVVAQTKTDDFVTFINPSWAKGASAVARLILMANKERPDIRFQIVETREKFVTALQALRNPGEPVGTAFRGQTFNNVAIRPATARVSEIYASTGVLLAPSFWYESWGRVATEAVMNGIPVLASDRGGLPEAVNGGGYNLPLPPSITEDSESWTVLPTEEEMRPWADRLYELYDNRAAWREKCLKAAEGLSPDVSAQRLLRILKPLLDRRAGDGPDFNIRGSVRFSEDPLPELQK